jgi:hypothetical protein
MVLFGQQMVLGFPMDEQELDKISEGFARYSHDRINGCVLAVDGILITKCPRLHVDVPDTRIYYNRKGSFGLVIQT